jgi:hypothetical protein
MGTFVTVTTALAVILAAARQPAAAGDEPEEINPPVVDGKPVMVTIGFYPLDFARITAREESFDLTGYLELGWRDLRVAASEGGSGSGSSDKKVRRLDASRIWMPQVFFENALEQPRFHNDPVVEADPAGNVTSWVIVSGKFSSPMDLRRFPFDRQVLSVRIGEFKDESVVKFVPNPDLIQVGDEAFLTDWVLGTPTARVDSHTYVPRQESYTRYVYRVAITRQPTFYVWRVMFPLTLLALVAWAAFWFEPVGLQPQISTCMAALIALVAFNFAIDFSLPKVGYLTLVDKHALIGIAFVVACVAAVTVVHLNVDHQNVGRARRIQKIARWTFLPGYAIAVLLNLAAAV